jgi:chromosome segregation ATPase
MFSEELDKLRVDLHDTQLRAQLAEREQTRLADSLAQWRHRAEQAEELARSREGEIQSQHQRIRQLAGETARISQLEADVSAARSESRDFREECERLTDRQEKLRHELDDARDELSAVKADNVTLHAELDPTRKILEAMRRVDEGRRDISDELERLRL